MFNMKLNLYNGPKLESEELLSLSELSVFNKNNQG